MINLMLQGRQPIIYGDGEQTRCFSYVTDCVAPLVKMLDTDNVNGEVINIGPDEETVTINQLYRLLQNILDFSCEPIYMPDRPQEVKEATCSADKARSLLDYQINVNLETGLRTMIDHIALIGPRMFTYHLDLEIINDLTPATWRERIF